jgi:hypothetical protein
MPQPSVPSTTQAFQLPGFPSAQNTGPQPRATVQPQPTPQQPTPPPSFPTPPAQHARPATARGRHSAGEDPLTSAAYSLRSGESVDGRSYQASRRAREPAGPSAPQDTQAFSTNTPPYGYPASRPNRDGNGTAAYPYPYGQPGQQSHQPGQQSHQPSQQSQPRQARQAMPLTQTPPHGEGYRHDGAHYDSAYYESGHYESGQGAGGDRGTGDPRWGSAAWDPAARDSGAWEYGRPAANGARPDPRAERPAYQGGYPGPYDPRRTERR